MLLVTRRSFWTCALALLALPVAAAQLDTNDLLRCHAIAATDQKLACYEALAVSAQSSATTAAVASAAAVGPAASGAAAANVTAAGTTASGVSGPGGATSGTSVPGAAAVGSPTPTAAVTNLNTEANFGLNRRQIEPQAQAQGPASIKSVVSEITENRQHHITVVLENGQTWAFIEPEPRLRPGDTVTIKHASLGSFLMLTPNHRSYRVERSR
jgi:hypothetical protein